MNLSKARIIGSLALAMMLAAGPAMANGDEPIRNEGTYGHRSSPRLQVSSAATISFERGVRVIRAKPERNRIYFDRGPEYFVPQYDSGVNSGAVNNVAEATNVTDGGFGFGRIGHAGRLHRKAPFGSRVMKTSGKLGVHVRHGTRHR